MQPEVIWKPRAGVGGETKPSAPESIPRLIWEILSSRGYTTEEAIRNFLTPSLKNLREPLTLREMDKAVERLLKAFETNEKICIYCDYDLDGTSACAMLKLAFERLGFKNVQHYQPKRLSEGYGLHKAAIQKISEQGVTLIMTADLGITAVEEVDFARTLGVDMIITDHHLPKEELPKAIAVVNPNRGNCESGLGHLCGTGVAFYLILALRKAMLERGLTADAFDPKILLDCFAIGTLTDMVPLIDENRVLVKHGLLALAQTQRPGLRALMQALNMWGNPLTSQDVAIRFAPKLNALSRMETGVQPLDIYLAKDPAEADRLVSEVLANNQMRQASQREAEGEALNQLKVRPPKGAAFVWSPNFHRGVVGLVATRVSQDLGLPAFIGAVDPDGRIVGSGRMPDGFDLSLLDALEANKELLTQFGGHAAACGFEVEAENAEALREGLDRYFQAKISEAKPSEWLYDCECDITELGPQFMQWYEHLSPFGAQFEAPLFLLKRVQVQSCQPLKGGHLRMSLGDSPMTARSAIWFSPPKAVLENQPQPGSRMDALVEPQWNYFNGRKNLQLLVHDGRLA
jgi:single-stranded-DNA-specific exonuclease